MSNDQLVNKASALARLWATTQPPSRSQPAPTPLTRLAKSPDQVGSALWLIDRLTPASAPDVLVSALREAPSDGFSFLPPIARAALKTGQILAPHAAKPLAGSLQSSIRGVWSDLVINNDGEELTRHIASTLARGQRLNLAPVGGAAVTEAQAQAHIQQLMGMLARSDVDYVSCSIPTVAHALNRWDLQTETHRVSERLRDVFTQAASTTPHKFIHFDAHSYLDLPLVVEVFENLLTKREYMHLSAGITVQAYLPHSNEVIERLISFGLNRVEAGGAPIKVRLVKGGRLDAEKLVAQQAGWPSPTYPSKRDTDANFLRLIDKVLKPEIAYALRLGVASHNLFHLAYAHLLATERGVGPALDVEMVRGILPAQQRAIAAEVDNPIVVYTPVASQDRYDLAAPYLTQRVTEATTPGGFLHDLINDRLDDQEQAFIEASTHSPLTSSNRCAVIDLDSTDEVFVNLPAADPTLGATREAYLNALEQTPQRVSVEHASTQQIDTLLTTAKTAGQHWSQIDPSRRREALDSVAQALQNRRGEFTAALVRQGPYTLPQADECVRWVIDSARFYGRQAIDLPGIGNEGVTFTPDRVVVFAALASLPLSHGVASVLATLAAGGACVVDTGGEEAGCLPLVIEAIQEGLEGYGPATELVHLVCTSEHDRDHLIAHPDVDSVVVEGDDATAQRCVSLRADRPDGPRVYAYTHGVNAVMVTPCADVDRAVAHIVDDALRGGLHDWRRAHVVILVGGVDANPVFVAKLVEAVAAVKVDMQNIPSQEEADNLFPQLEAGERWLLPPQHDQDHGWWVPGVKAAGEPHWDYIVEHLHLPVLTIVEASTFDDALSWQNTNDHALVAGLHSRSDQQIARWLTQAEVGNAYVNKAIRSTMVGRHPIGGWKKSTLGQGAKIGGPHFLTQLGQWTQVEPPSQFGEIGPRVGQFLDLTAPWVSQTERDWLRTAARSDAHAREVYRTPVDNSAGTQELHLLRYHPSPLVTIRAGDNARIVEVLRLYAAALAVGVEVDVSIAPELLTQLPPTEEFLAQAGSVSEPNGTPVDGEVNEGGQSGIEHWRAETLEEFLARLTECGHHRRVRVVDGAEVPVIAQSAAPISLLPGPALQSGRAELLTFLREQVVSAQGCRLGVEGRLEATPQERTQHTSA